MKNELISIFCIAIVCAAVMLGIMSIYRLAGSSARNRLEGGERLRAVSETFYPGEKSSAGFAFR